MRRYIYIHGCPDEDHMGELTSRGCVKMRKYRCGNMTYNKPFENRRPPSSAAAQGRRYGA